MLLATTYDVGAGLRVRLRLARPQDAERVRAFLAELSPQTRRRRFSEEEERATADLLRRFTFYDPRERLVVAATAPIDGGEDVVGLADVELRATGLAEVGVVVDDRAQGRGVGRLLVEAVASLALRRGASRLRASLRGENEPMRRLLAWLGPTTEVAEDEGPALYVELPAAARRRPAA